MYTSSFVTAKQICAEVGIPTSTFWTMVRDGYLIPAVPSAGRGQEALFPETAIRQAQAAVAVRRLMGDGEAARGVLRGLAADPLEREFDISDPDAGVSLRLSFV